MHLDSIQLTNYRNYSKQNLRFNNGVNVFLGENGQGKTNLLDAIYTLTKGNSFRPGTVESSLNKKNNSYMAMIQAIIENKGLKSLVRFEIFYIAQFPQPFKSVLRTVFEEAFKDIPSIKVKTYQGLTVDFCKKEDASFILRGLRNPADFEFEKAIAHTNRDLAPIETIFLLTAASTSYISSSIVRDVIRNDGDYTKLVPKSVRVK